jgi:hypothetical protein
MDSSAYGTHSMRRTKAAQIYRTHLTTAGESLHAPVRVGMEDVRA